MGRGAWRAAVHGVTKSQTQLSKPTHTHRYCCYLLHSDCSLPELLEDLYHQKSVCVRVRACVFACTHACVCMCVHVCACVCMHMCVCVCVCVDSKWREQS